MHKWQISHGAHGAASAVTPGLSPRLILVWLRLWLTVSLFSGRSTTWPITDQLFLGICLNWSVNLFTTSKTQTTNSSSFACPSSETQKKNKCPREILMARHTRAARPQDLTRPLFSLAGFFRVSLSERGTSRSLRIWCAKEQSSLCLLHADWMMLNNAQFYHRVREQEDKRIPKVS